MFQVVGAKLSLKTFCGEAGRTVSAEEDRAESNHRLLTLVRCNMLTHQRGVAKHVIIQEDDYFALGGAKASVARTRGTAVFLFDNAKPAGRFDSAQDGARTVGRAVHDDDDLELRGRKVLLKKRS
jgi:hypothetical protein